MGFAGGGSRWTLWLLELFAKVLDKKGGAREVRPYMKAAPLGGTVRLLDRCQLCLHGIYFSGLVLKDRFKYLTWEGDN